MAGSWRNNGLPGTPPLNDGEWHHVVARFDAGIDGGTGRATLYVDGAFVNESSQTLHAMSTNNLPVTIGGRKNPGSPSWNGGTRSRYFKGLIDEVAIYNRALSETEIEELASGEPTDTTPPEIASTVGSTSLWPPNHSMQLVVSGISATDDVDGAVTPVIAVSSSDDGNGDGNTEVDYEVVENDDGSFDVYVRAERSGNGDGRIYTITVDAADQAGNAAETQTIEVAVAHDKGKKAGKPTTGAQGASWGEIKKAIQ